MNPESELYRAILTLTPEEEIKVLAYVETLRTPQKQAPAAPPPPLPPA
jgi:hypothetical protein